MAPGRVLGHPEVSEYIQSLREGVITLQPVMDTVAFDWRAWVQTSWKPYLGKITCASDPVVDAVFAANCDVEDINKPGQPRWELVLTKESGARVKLYPRAIPIFESPARAAAFPVGEIGSPAKILWTSEEANRTPEVYHLGGKDAIDYLAKVEQETPESPEINHDVHVIHDLTDGQRWKWWRWLKSWKGRRGGQLWQNREGIVAFAVVRLKQAYLDSLGQRAEHCRLLAFAAIMQTADLETDTHVKLLLCNHAREPRFKAIRPSHAPASCWITEAVPHQSLWQVAWRAGLGLQASLPEAAQEQRAPGLPQSQTTSRSDQPLEIQNLPHPRRSPPHPQTQTNTRLQTGPLHTQFPPPDTSPGQPPAQPLSNHRPAPPCALQTTTRCQTAQLAIPPKPQRATPRPQAQTATEQRTLPARTQLMLPAPSPVPPTHQAESNPRPALLAGRPHRRWTPPPPQVTPQIPALESPQEKAPAGEDAPDTEIVWCV